MRPALFAALFAILVAAGFAWRIAIDDAYHRGFAAGQARAADNGACLAWWFNGDTTRVLKAVASHCKTKK